MKNGEWEGIDLTGEDEEFLEQLLETKKVCYSCHEEVDVDYGQSQTFCPNCQTITLVVTPK